MEITIFYAIAVGCLLTTLFLIRIAPSFLNLLGILSFLITKHLTYPYLWGRYRLIAPCTRADALLYLAYAVTNVFLVAFKTPSTTMARDRAGTLSVINMSFLFLAHHLGFLANAMGVSLMACKRIHRAVGWMTGILLGLHIIMAMITDRKSWILREKPNLFVLISKEVIPLKGSVIIAAILLSSFPFIRRFLYEPFLRLHQALATACIYSIWRHLPSGALLPRLNGVFPPRPYSRASIRCDRVQQTPIQSKEATPLKVRIALTRPLHIQAGQYISLWIPAASLFSWAQTHPFMVTSWSPEKQDVLELFVQPRRGLTETIHHRTALDGYTSLTAFVGGPYGVSKSVDHYECVLAIATDFGIAGVISYLKKLLYGYNTCTSHVRRVHFVWEIQTLDIAVAAQPLLNSLLSDDILDDGYILEMSFFVASNQMIEHGKPFGQHRRATVFNGKPRYDEIISEEASGRNIKRLPNTHEDRGEVLVMVSASHEVRDRLRELVRKHLEQRVRLHETEFQPS
ncbi:Flavoprotein transmembrane component [Penicillium roqueforti FM164]|uniref:Flavoprotein transmembrane component n=1 Tax=Penicillium roqueforti (strain FM164) TaxID=1365484 RepID=W6Q1R6_PENRF|nr:Flavoprotein transmembrane component [Penicillium roqueforti FM164]